MYVTHRVPRTMRNPCNTSYKPTGLHTPLLCSRSGIPSGGQLQPHIQVVPKLPPKLIPHIRARRYALPAEPLIPPRDLHQVLQAH